VQSLIEDQHFTGCRTEKLSREAEYQQCWPELSIEVIDAYWVSFRIKNNPAHEAVMRNEKFVDFSQRGQTGYERND
jgi:hypothetical protein